MKHVADPAMKCRSVHTKSAFADSGFASPRRRTSYVQTGISLPGLSVILLLFCLLSSAVAQGRPPAGLRGGATLISVQGPATVRPSGGTAFVPAARKMPLAAGDILRTGPNGRAVLLFADGSQVKLNANTILLIPEAASGRGLPPRLGLSGGEVWARVTRGRRELKRMFYLAIPPVPAASDERQIPLP